MRLGLAGFLMLMMLLLMLASVSASAGTLLNPGDIEFPGYQPAQVDKLILVK